MKILLRASFVIALTLVAVAAAAQSNGGVLNARRPMISGAFNDEDGGRGTFSGVMTVNRFQIQGGAVVAEGSLIGVLSDAAGEVVARVKQPVVRPATVVSANCQALRVEFEPVDLDVQGKSVSFSEVQTSVTSSESQDPAFAALLCAAPNHIAAKPTEQLMALLNEMLRLLKP